MHAYSDIYRHYIRDLLRLQLCSLEKSYHWTSKATVKIIGSQSNIATSVLFVVNAHMGDDVHGWDDSGAQQRTILDILVVKVMPTLDPELVSLLGLTLSIIFVVQGYDL